MCVCVWSGLFPSPVSKPAECSTFESFHKIQKFPIAGFIVRQNCGGLDFRVGPSKFEVSIAGVKARQNCGSTFESSNFTKLFSIIGVKARFNFRVVPLKSEIFNRRCQDQAELWFYTWVVPLKSENFHNRCAPKGEERKMKKMLRLVHMCVFYILSQTMQRHDSSQGVTAGRKRQVATS